MLNEPDTLKTQNAVLTEHAARSRAAVAMYVRQLCAVLNAIYREPASGLLILALYDALNDILLKMLHDIGLELTKDCGITANVGPGDLPFRIFMPKTGPLTVDSGVEIK